MIKLGDIQAFSHESEPVAMVVTSALA